MVVDDCFWSILARIEKTGRKCVFVGNQPTVWLPLYHTGVCGILYDGCVIGGDGGSILGS
jgi:hypothetical protein